MFCDCPYADDGNYCKHMAAVLYEIEGGEVEVKPKKTLFKRIDESMMKLQQVVAKIPENEFRKLMSKVIYVQCKL